MAVPQEELWSGEWRVRVGVEGTEVVLCPGIVGPWLGSACLLAYHSTSPSQLRDLMSIRTIPFECGGLWNESFPELLVQSCTVDPATHRLGPTRRWAVIVCNLYSRMELSFSETVCCNICFIFKTVHCASSSAFLPFFFSSFFYFFIFSFIFFVVITFSQLRCLPILDRVGIE